MFCIRDTSLEIPRILCRAALDIGGYIGGVPTALRPRTVIFFKSDHMAAWPHGRMAAWPHGRMAAWPHGWPCGRFLVKFWSFFNDIRAS